MAKQKSKSAETTAAPGRTGEYTVLARRYRPQQFADLIGQEPVARALTNAIQSDRVAHAYLFTGVRGTGKTSTARILAKALNCVNGPTPTPCDQCEICQSVTSGQDIDVLEIDGASNNKAEEARDLRQTVGTRPARARYKIYIIDEVHMLSTAAFNVLLKTLEEPPPHVKFIFATTEVQKVPLTILSRCQRFDFTGITSSRIAEHLKQIVKAENAEADDDALMIVARRAGGSMRDAQSLLDQLIAYDGEKLTADRVHQILGTATDERMLKLVRTVVDRDAAQAFTLLASFHEEGLQLGELLDQLIDYWRCLMVLNTAGRNYPDVSLTEAHRQQAFEYAQSLALDSILAGLDVLTTTKSRLRGSNHGLVLLEMAVLRLIRLDELLPIAQVIAQLGQAGTAQLADLSKKNSLTAAEAGTPVFTTTTKPAQAPRVAVGTTPSANRSIEEIWSEVLQKEGPMLVAQLAMGKPPAISGPNSLVISFINRYTSAYDYCSQSRNVEGLQKSLQAVTGQSWTVRFDIDRTVENTGTNPVPEADATKPVTHRSRSEQVKKIPLIDAAMDKLGARLLKVDDGFGQTDSPVGTETATSEEP